MEYESKKYVKGIISDSIYTCIAVICRIMFVWNSKKHNLNVLFYFYFFVREHMKGGGVEKDPKPVNIYIYISFKSQCFGQEYTRARM